MCYRCSTCSILQIYEHKFELTHGKSINRTVQYYSTVYLYSWTDDPTPPHEWVRTIQIPNGQIFKFLTVKNSNCDNTGEQPSKHVYNIPKTLDHNI